MSLAKITLYGMQRWMLDNNDNLFSEMSLPTGWDSSLLIDTIMMHGAEFEVLYANPHYMKSMIGTWSDKWYHTLDRWQKALAIDYDPLENYDRRESWSDIGQKGRNDSRNTSGSSNRAENDAARSTGTTASTASTSTKHGSETEHFVSAYDSSAYEPESKDKTTNDNTDGTDASSAINSTKNSSARTSFDIHKDDESGRESESSAASHHGRIHGNIGVTTSQQMLQAELDIARFGMYDEAANLFLTELCIYTY